MVGTTLAAKLLRKHLVSGEMSPGREVGLRATQALLTDVLGTLVVLELEAMGVERVKIGLAAQYVDHNLLEVDHLNAEEHRFLRSACRKLGIWYARARTGISHPVHMERFARPGELLVGCDSHTCAGGSMGMLAIGMGGIDVALAMAGEPVFIAMPEIWGVRLDGQLPDWVSAMIAETGTTVALRHALSARQIDLIEAGGAINLFRATRAAPARPITSERQ